MAAHRHPVRRRPTVGLSLEARLFSLAWLYEVAVPDGALRLGRLTDRTCADTMKIPWW